jgi:hypothetical protein
VRSCNYLGNPDVLTNSGRLKKGNLNSSICFLVLIGIGIIFLMTGIVGCVKERKSQKEISMPIEEVLKKHTPELMSIPGVVGTGIGMDKDKKCILVLVLKKTPEMKKQIPSVIKGFPVKIEETGQITPHQR